MTKYIARPNTWFKEGTEARLLVYCFTNNEGVDVGLFEGTHIVDSKNEVKAFNLLLGTEREDEEMCRYDEFDVIEE